MSGIIAICFIVALLVFRYFYYYILYKFYIGWVIWYFSHTNKVLEKNALEEFAEYISIWPIHQIMARIWIWDLRTFIINQDYFDLVIEALKKERLKNV